MDKELTLVEHLEELRRRLIVSLALIFALSLAAFPAARKLLVVLKAPSSGMIDRLAFFNPAEAFIIHIKISFFAGLVASVPVLLFQLWAFLSPAMADETKRHGTLFLISSLAAFISGGLFGFLVLLPAALNFLLGYARESLQAVISVSSYISFVLALVLGCGLVFEMPVLSYLLTRVGLIDHRFLRRIWRYAVIAVFIIAAVITPTPDIFGMTILAIPMLLLYELSIWVSMLAGRKKR